MEVQSSKVFFEKSQASKPSHFDYYLFTIEILKQMNAGVPVTDKKKVLTITDRREAIKSAVMFAQKSDIILLAGKGHEKYQEIKGVKTHFDDKEELKKMFEEAEK